MKRCSIYLQNGLFFEASSFGAEGTAVGEIVFNTSLSGYQEIITDPSYAGQFITFTMTEIGNVGINPQDNESRGIYAKGAIVRNYQPRPSNFRSEEPLGAFLARNGILGICDIDTRLLTQTIRKEGAMMMVASTEVHDRHELSRLLDAQPPIGEVNFLEEVATQKAYVHTQGSWNHQALCFRKAQEGGKKVLAYDFGAKLNILNELVDAGLCVEVIPYNTPAETVIARYEAGEIGGVFLSNGPGDPMVLEEQIAIIKALIAKKIPMFGICLGHQLLSIAHGYPTHKLKFGHHGGNQPVKNLKTGAVEITSQNHNYSVPDNITEIAEVTHLNLFDNTIEGVRYHDAPIFSVQHHPEASPGPRESRYLFKAFAELIDAHAPTR